MTTYKLKPLEWKLIYEDGTSLVTNTIIGTLHVGRLSDGSYRWHCPGGSGFCDSIEEGMIVVDEYYRQYILQALEPVVAE